jgi:methylated-DNA-[protein]-cysteine S-methyltransferase
MQSFSVISSPIGNLTFCTENNYLTRIEFSSPETPLKSPETALEKEIERQLTAYFKNPRFVFTLPYSLLGTPFQVQLWKHLAQIPTGQTRTYGEIADLLHSSPRAIGNACRNNPLPIIFPCHRVVGQHDIGGFAGATTGSLINIKQTLLRHEHALAKYRGNAPKSLEVCLI